MKEKLLKEKGAVKVWVIVLVIVLCLAIAGGIFAYVKINADKEEDDDSKSTSQSKEKKNSDKDDDEDKDSKKDEDEDEDDDEDEDEKDSKKDSKNDSKTSSKERHFTAKLDSSMLGEEGMEWSLDVYGSDKDISKLVITFDLKEAAKKQYETVKDQYATYDEFIKDLHKTMEESFSGLEESFASSAGIDSEDISGNFKWKNDEVLEFTIDFSKIKFDDLDMELNESGSVIESLVEHLEDEANVTMKEVK